MSIFKDLISTIFSKFHISMALFMTTMNFSVHEILHITMYQNVIWAAISIVCSVSEKNLMFQKK